MHAGRREALARPARAHCRGSIRNSWGPAVLWATADRPGIDTADVDDIIWGTSSQRGAQSGDLGLMSALDAGYDVRASGVTRDRFCGSGITSVNMAANFIMSGSEDLVFAGGTG